jgi:hypothetical protein
MPLKQEQLLCMGGGETRMGGFFGGRVSRIRKLQGGGGGQTSMLC